MKASNQFTRTILTYLEQRAETDKLFAERFAREDKSIDDCVTYILNQVQKSGCNGFADDEIYSMAMHYYDEDEIEIGKPMQGNIVVNHVVQLTEEEKEQARQDAIQKAVNESYNKLTIKKKSSTKQNFFFQNHKTFFCGEQKCCQGFSQKNTLLKKGRLF